MIPTTSVPNIGDLSREVAALRSFVIGMAGKDSEGRYNPQFVKRIVQASKEKIADQFEDAVSFLQRL